jgi:hypothetical protein
MTTTTSATSATTSVDAVSRRTAVSLRAALTAGATAGVAAAVVNVTISAVARAAFGVSDDFTPLTPGPIVMWTILAAIIGAAGWRFFVNRSVRSGALINKLVPTVLVLSFIPDVALLATDAMPGTTTAAVLSLMAMHVVTALIVVFAYRRAMPVR